jgi:hypothetical protein
MGVALGYSAGRKLKAGLMGDKVGQLRLPIRGPYLAGTVEGALLGGGSSLRWSDDLNGGRQDRVAIIDAPYESPGASVSGLSFCPSP